MVPAHPPPAEKVPPKLEEVPDEAEAAKVTADPPPADNVPPKPEEVSVDAGAAKVDPPPAHKAPPKTEEVPGGAEAAEVPAALPAGKAPPKEVPAEVAAATETPAGLLPPTEVSAEAAKQVSSLQLAGVLSPAASLPACLSDRHTSSSLSVIASAIDTDSGAPLRSSDSQSDELDDSQGTQELLSQLCETMTESRISAGSNMESDLSPSLTLGGDDDDHFNFLRGHEEHPPPELPLPRPDLEIPLDAEGKVNPATFLDEAANIMGNILINTGQCLKASTARFLMSSVGVLCAGSGLGALVDKSVVNFVSDHCAELIQTDVAVMVELEEWKRDYLHQNIDRSACICDDVSLLKSGTMKCKTPGHEDCQRWQNCQIDFIEGGFSCTDFSAANPKNSQNKDAIKKNKQDLSSVKTFFGILEFMKQFQPKFVILENVDNLGSADHPDSNMSNIIEVFRGLVNQEPDGARGGREESGRAVKPRDASRS